MTSQTEEVEPVKNQWSLGKTYCKLPFHFTVYLTIIARTRAGYEMVVSNKREWNNCFIKNALKNTNNSLHFGAKICSHICSRTLSVTGREKFSESLAGGTDYVQGQISHHIFAPNGGYCVCYPSNIFCNTRSFEN